MGCHKSLTFAPAQGDTPIDQAVYVPAVGPRAAFIVGTFNGKLFKFDPDSGALLSQAQIFWPGPAFGCVAYFAPTDKIYMGLWGPLDMYGDARPTRDSDCNLYSLDPSDLSVATSLALQTFFLGLHASEIPTDYNSIMGGVFRIVPCGSWLAIVTNPNDGAVGMLDPSGTTVFVGSAYGEPSIASTWWREPCYVAADSKIWINTPEVPELSNFDLTTYPTGGFPHNLDTYYDYINWPYPFSESAFGLCCSDVNHCLYVSTGTPTVVKYDITGDAFSEIPLAQPNAVPVTARYNSVDQKVYVPCWGDDTVCVIDPTNADAVVVKTGFDCPCDVVFTLTKAFAVQQGGIGLKEIT